MTGSGGLIRCDWATSAAEYIAYHDDEWGRAVHGDDAVFERLTLEAFQSGLSWITILRKRENFRAAFGGFSIPVVAAFGERDEYRLDLTAPNFRARLGDHGRVLGSGTGGGQETLDDGRGVGRWISSGPIFGLSS